MPASGDFLIALSEVSIIATLFYEQVTGWDSFEPVLNRAEQTTGRDLWKLAQGMPHEWWSRNSCVPLD